ncbi:hypothetical protein [Plantibacter sp. ME-Dv--P-122b]|uniref:hypothetical protein n=1 Tax=Plantibacter sp. ME-Dv--P-122b TaxID=3040300 RepID=UPI002551583C|nr:hypothetical protein [Plantibacter sp. ME-Dv--P-122b]
MRSATTTTLLRCAAFGAVGALVLLLVSPLTSTAAVLNPVLYAAIAAVTMVMPMLARRWTGTPGATVLTAAVTGVLALAFTALGPAIIVALVVPAAAIDLVLARRRDPGRVVTWLAAAAGGVAIWALSFAVISPGLVSPVLVMVLLAVRVVSYVLAMELAGLVARRLRRSGVRSVRAASRRDDARRGSSDA